MLVEAAVKALRGVTSPVVVDIGTGTGCIAVAIAKEVPSAIVHAVDLSSAALEVARENVRRHGVEGRVRLHLGDLFAPLAGVVAPGSVDVVVSNPPYVRRDEEFDPELRFEPELALFVEDVPGVYRRIAEAAAKFVRPGGALYCELPGAPSDAAIDAIRACREWMCVSSRRDLGGHERIVVAVRVQSGLEHRVAVVVDPEYGDRVSELSERVHVWLVESPSNLAAAERFWQAHASEYSLDRGITVFRGRPACAPDELVCEILETINDHHGEWSHDPPWSVLLVRGTTATPRLRAALAARGFTEVEPEANGFRAARPAIRSE
jgi:tRNA1(Val) A37 N6-methylase TrmN6